MIQHLIVVVNTVVSLSCGTTEVTTSYPLYDHWNSVEVADTSEQSDGSSQAVGGVSDCYPLPNHENGVEVSDTTEQSGDSTGGNRGVSDCYPTTNELEHYVFEGGGSRGPSSASLRSVCPQKKDPKPHKPTLRVGLFQGPKVTSPKTRTSCSEPQGAAGFPGLPTAAPTVTVTTLSQPEVN